MAIRKLIGSIQNYAWGSNTVLALLQGRPTPTPLPEAEIWFGAHPQAPSLLDVDGHQHRLDVYLEEHGLNELGPRVVAEFRKLPFLLKLLAIEKPLSIQVHPSPVQAKLGYERERALGIGADDPRANYRDDWAKPELVCPLEPFEALCGFRPIEELVVELRSLGGECFEEAARILESAGAAEGLPRLTKSWLSASGDEKRSKYSSAIEACLGAIGLDTAVGNSARLAVGLGQYYPGDMGVLVALLLRHWSLRAGEALFIPAGVMHAYLKGFALEVMATSDNVLRGGLTPKHVDVPELLNLVDFMGASAHVATTEERGPIETAYLTDTPQFRLSTVELSPHMSYCARPRVGPEMFLCFEGELDVVAAGERELRLRQGECAWVSASEDVYCVAGHGRAARVQVGNSSGGFGT